LFLSCAKSTGVALTTDMWTSRAMEGYITVTCHFVNEEWQGVSYVLATAGFVQSHTAVNIANRLVEITEDMLICGKVIAITHDEAANQCAAIREACSAAGGKYPGTSG